MPSPELIIKATAKSLILPPGILIIFLLLGLLLQIRYRRLGVFLILISTLALYGLSTPYVAHTISRQVEVDPALSLADFSDSSVGAIVILGGGRRSEAPEYNGNDTVSDTALARLRYGAEIQRSTELPILVTGGTVLTEGQAEGELMAEVLKGSYGINDVWIESESSDTYQNALYSKQFLEEKSIGHVILVTHASHMPRASEAYTKVGLKVTPAPMGFRAANPMNHVYMDFMPSAGALNNSRAALHELVGRLWYQMRHY